MTVNIKYKQNGADRMLIVVGEDMEVEMLVDKGIEIIQIPSEEWNQGFRAKEVKE